MVLGACWSRHPLQAAAPAAPSEARVGKVVARSLRDCVSWGEQRSFPPEQGLEPPLTQGAEGGQRLQPPRHRFFMYFLLLLLPCYQKKK